MERLSRRGTTDPEAYQLYLRGRHFMVGTSEEMDRGVEMLREATAKDPEFALAHAMLAETHLQRALHGQSDAREAEQAARAALDRAVAIDPDLAEAHVVAGNIRLLFDWDWPAADAEFRRAIEVAPGSSLAHMEYAFIKWFVGDYDKALEHSRRALELDPLSRGPMHHIGFSNLAARRYDEAIAGFLKVIEVYPDWIWGHTKLGVAYAFNDMPAEALASAARAEGLIEKGGETPLLRSWLGVIYARSGKEAQARQALQRLESLARERNVDAIVFAGIHAALGEKEAALDWLEKGYEEHSITMPWVAEHLFFDGLRDEPRFQSLVERIGLPTGARS